MILVHYLADLRRRRHIRDDGEPWSDDPPQPYTIPDDTPAAAFVEALEAVLIPRLFDTEMQHVYADMILCDLLLWAMTTHEDGDVVSATHTFVARYQAIDKWYA